MQRHAVLKLLLHHIGHRRGCHHAFLHHRYRSLGLPDIAFSGLRFTVGTLVIMVPLSAYSRIRNYVKTGVEKILPPNLLEDD